jgi:IS4 transposase
VDRNTGLRCDQNVVLVNFYAHRDYPDKLRLVKFIDPETGRYLVFLTNNFTIPAITVAERYRCRWQVELFFRWLIEKKPILSALVPPPYIKPDSIPDNQLQLFKC